MNKPMTFVLSTPTEFRPLGLLRRPCNPISEPCHAISYSYCIGREAKWWIVWHFCPGIIQASDCDKGRACNGGSWLPYDSRGDLINGYCPFNGAIHPPTAVPFCHSSYLSLWQSWSLFVVKSLFEEIKKIYFLSCLPNVKFSKKEIKHAFFCCHFGKIWYSARGTETLSCLLVTLYYITRHSSL